MNAVTTSFGCRLEYRCGKPDRLRLPDGPRPAPGPQNPGEFSQSEAIWKYPLHDMAEKKSFLRPDPVPAPLPGKHGRRHR